MPKLIYHDSDGVDKTYNLGADPVTIGRATECQIQTQDAMVSRRHARISWDGNYWVEDLGSSNGVYVGHEKVSKAPFRPGDIVTCGSLVLRMMPDTQPRMNTAPDAVMDAEELGFEETPSSAGLSAAPVAAPAASVQKPATRQHPVPVPSAPDPQTVAELQQERTRREQAENALLSAAERTSVAEARATELEAQVREAKRDKDRLKQRVTDLESEVERAMAVKPLPPVDDPEKIQLQKDVKLLMAELNQLREAQEHAHEVTRDDSERMARLAAEEQSTHLRQRVEELEGELESERERLKRRLAATQAELEQALAAKPAVDPGALRAAEEERDRLHMQVDNLRADLQEAQAGGEERERLQKKVAGLEAELVKARQPVEDPEKAALQHQVEQLMSDLRNVETSMAKSSGAEAERVAELSDKLRQVTGERDGARAEAQKAAQAAQAAEHSRAQLSAELDAVKKEAEAASDRAREQAAQAELARERMTHATAQAAGAGAEAAAAAQREVEELRAENQRLHAQAESAGAELKRLQTQAESAGAELKRLHAQAESAGADAGRVHELNQALERATAEREAARHELAQIHEQFAAAHDELNAARREAEHALADAESARADVKRAEERAHQAEEQAQKAHGEAQHAQEQLKASPPAHAAAAGGAHDPASADAAVALGDALAELRSSLRAASDEATVLTAPPDSVQVVADALSQATEQLENARANLRTLHNLLGVS
jgi:chromosome segregation ATPase